MPATPGSQKGERSRTARYEPAGWFVEQVRRIARQRQHRRARQSRRCRGARLQRLACRRRQRTRRASRSCRRRDRTARDVAPRPLMTLMPPASRLKTSRSRAARKPSCLEVGGGPRLQEPGGELLRSVRSSVLPVADAGAVRRRSGTPRRRARSEGRPRAPCRRHRATRSRAWRPASRLIEQREGDGAAVHAEPSPATT